MDLSQTCFLVSRPQTVKEETSALVLASSSYIASKAFENQRG